MKCTKYLASISEHLQAAVIHYSACNLHFNQFNLTFYQFSSMKYKPNLMISQRLGRSKIDPKIFVRCGSSLFNILRYYKSRLANTRNCKRRQSQFPDKILFMSRYILKWPLHYLASIIIASKDTIYTKLALMP